MTAMAMAPRPDLIIFDEPTMALDVKSQVEMLTTPGKIPIQSSIANPTVPPMFHWPPSGLSGAAIQMRNLGQLCPLAEPQRSRSGANPLDLFQSRRRNKRTIVSKLAAHE